MENDIKFDIFSSRDETHKIPAKSGIYFLYSDNKELLYVGQSKNLRTRVRKHLRVFTYKGYNEYYKNFYCIGLFLFNESELDERELYFISKYKPLLNIKDVDYTVNTDSFDFNDHDTPIILRCNVKSFTDEPCNLYARENGYCFVHDPSEPFFWWITKGKLVTTEMQRLLYEVPRGAVQKGMYFYMSKRTFNKFMDENQHLETDIQGSNSYMKFGNHEIVIDDCEVIRLEQYKIRVE